MFGGRRGDVLRMRGRGHRVRLSHYGGGMVLEVEGFRRRGIMVLFAMQRGHHW